MAKNQHYPFWKNLRILVWLIILLIVAIDAFFDQNQNWDKPILVLLHPINPDNDPDVAQYIAKLSSKDFSQSKQYLENNIQHYYQKPTAVYFDYGRQIAEKPPAIPTNAGVSDVILWSLKFRYYAWKSKTSADKNATVRLYLNYYNADKYKSLKHSTALEKGKIGVINLFASDKQHGSNQVIVVHELLHAFGATDKYDVQTGQPLDPIGLAEPDKLPKYPQQKAEIMGGYIAVSPTKSYTPHGLEDTLVSEITAREVGWLK